MTPRLRIIWRVLERAKDCNDETVIAACRRLLRADRLGWRKHAQAHDKALVFAFNEC